MTLFLMGLLVSGMMHPILSAVYLIVFIGANVWFWKSICTHCRSFGNIGCPSGYGIISSRLFQPAVDPDFSRAFKQNIWVIVLQFTLPLIFSVPFLLFPSMSLYGDWAGNAIFYSTAALMMTAFSLIAFVWIPLHSRKKACETCPQNRDCPWIK
jgi:hypothetical protein